MSQPPERGVRVRTIGNLVLLAALLFGGWGLFGWRWAGYAMVVVLVVVVLMLREDFGGGAGA